MEALSGRSQPPLLKGSCKHLDVDQFGYAPPPNSSPNSTSMNMITRLAKQGRRTPAAWLKSYCHNIGQKSIPYSLIRYYKAYAVLQALLNICPFCTRHTVPLLFYQEQGSHPSLVSHCPNNHISLPCVSLVCIIWKAFIIFPKEYALVSSTFDPLLFPTMF